MDVGGCEFKPRSRPHMTLGVGGTPNQRKRVFRAPILLELQANALFCQNFI